MKIGSELYFAPGIRFSDLDWTGGEFPDQYQKRIHGFYLEPARKLADDNHAFAAGLILVSCIDALARLQNEPIDKDRLRFMTWIERELPSFKDPQVSSRFYDDFRNGLVHHAMIKRGGRFSLEQQATVDEQKGVLSISPSGLLDETKDAFRRYVSTLKRNNGVLQKLLVALKREFKFEIENCN